MPPERPNLFNILNTGLKDKVASPFFGEVHCSKYEDKNSYLEPWNLFIVMRQNKLIKRGKLAISLTTQLLVFFILIQVSLASDKYGLNETANTGYGDQLPLAGETNPSVFIGKIVGAGLAFIGAIFFILIIYGGYVWMMARGNEQEVTKAKELIYGAVIGLLIILAAYAITVYIGSVLGQ